MRPQFDYDPKRLPRELTKFYISANESDISQMMNDISIQKLSDLYAHIPKELHHKEKLNFSENLNYEQLADKLYEISLKNKIKTSFIGDGLQRYKNSSIVPFVCSLRELTTAYTPYQPERSQGTLQTIWIYQSLLSQLTGFEAINASMYDRSTATFEAIQTSLRIVKESNTILISKGIHPQDLEVITTQAKHTKLKIITIGLNKDTGTTDLEKLKGELKNSSISGVVFPHVNCLGLIENVDAITDLCYEYNIQSIAVIDPMLLATGGLKAPSTFGTKEQGVHMLTGEGQHLAIDSNFGGPGLGIFGIRFNEQNKNSIRATSGRFIGKGKDLKGRLCKAMVLSTREQHIRREKANSNICSNQSYISTIAGANLLALGEAGTKKAIKTAHDNAINAAKVLTRFKGVKLKFNKTSFFNELALVVPKNADEVIKNANHFGIHLGVNITNRINENSDQVILISFNDYHEEKDLDNLTNFFQKEFGDFFCGGQNFITPSTIDLRKDAVNLIQVPINELKQYYLDLASQNVSPDDNIYPLGSCTMKYNPYINDWAASLPGFTQTHPQAPVEDVQGNLQIIYETQEYFKEITGLKAVTTQPVAGAQGELVGIKMFQAYFEHKNEIKNRDILLIPKSAHGTNPATATVAGFETKIENGKTYGIVLIEANETGKMNLNHVKELVSTYQNRIAGMMVTNPNTSGIFETEFKVIADLVHSVGGLVYMDGANMNAIAGWIDLSKMGVDAVHNNTHKTWSIPHGGGGPGDAFVAVSEKLVDFLPGIQVVKNNDFYSINKPKYTMGSVHRHFGNFAHKVRAYTYLRALGNDGVKQMSAVAVLSARYLYQKLKTVYPVLPAGSENSPRMHEFIITLSKETFDKIESAGIPKANIIARVGKLFLDFGMHAPTVAFPEVYGLMIEPTETYSKKELDRFCDIVTAIYKLVLEKPQILNTVPHFTPIDRVDEVSANKDLVLSEKITKLDPPLFNRVNPHELNKMSVTDICKKLLEI